MIKFIFVRHFTKGNLEGLDHKDSITFPSMNDMEKWVDGINKKNRQGKVDYLVYPEWFASF